MLGSMLSKIRKEKHITKVELSKRTGINIGHLTHIEKGERNPSHKTLRIITNALEIPYQMIAYLYDKANTEDYNRCNMTNHLSYNKVLAVDSYSDYIECPKNITDASIAIKVKDNSMEPKLKKDSYAFVQLNVPLNTKDIYLSEDDDFMIIGKILISK